MNRGSLPIGKILLIAAVVIALIVFVRPLIMGTDKEATVSTNSEMSQAAPEAVAPATDAPAPEATPETTMPADATAPQSENMTPAAPAQETTAEPTTTETAPTNTN